jgi:hypothetical protein
VGNGEIETGLRRHGPGPARAEQTANRYQGTPISERSYPKTSQATANSNGDRRSGTSATTIGPALAGFLRTTSLLPLLAGPVQAHDGSMTDSIFCNSGPRRTRFPREAGQAPTGSIANLGLLGRGSRSPRFLAAGPATPP